MTGLIIFMVGVPLLAVLAGDTRQLQRKWEERDLPVLFWVCPSLAGGAPASLSSAASSFNQPTRVAVTLSSC